MSVTPIVLPDTSDDISSAVQLICLFFGLLLVEVPPGHPWWNWWEVISHQFCQLVNADILIVDTGRNIQSFRVKNSEPHLYMQRYAGWLFLFL